LGAFDLALAPFGWLDPLIVIAKEGFDRIAQLVFGFEAGAIERLPLQQTEHNLNLVEPTGRSRRVVKLDTAFELRQPGIVFLVRAVVVEDDVDFFVGKIIRE